jgi:hypothetical protein
MLVAEHRLKDDVKLTFHSPATPHRYAPIPRDLVLLVIDTVVVTGGIEEHVVGV